MKDAAVNSDAPTVNFPRSRRMLRPVEFQRVYASGRRFGNEFFTVNALANELTWTRLGMSIAARNLRRAVDRNRIRRLIRESFRVHQQLLPSLDIIIGARTTVMRADAATLRAALDKIWLKLAAACVS